MVMTLTGTGAQSPLELPNADLGNETTYEFNSAQKRTTGGSYRAVKDPSWPNFNSFTYAIGPITESEKDNFIEFLQDNAALPITLEDHRGITRTGQIANDQVEFVTLQDQCTYSTSFLFLTQDTP